MIEFSSLTFSRALRALTLVAGLTCLSGSSRAGEVDVAPAAPTTAPTPSPATHPSTEPTTKPAVKISSAAQAELDGIRDAYRALSSLHLKGTITGDFDINGEQSAHQGTFEADYQAGHDTGPRFRQSTKEGDVGGPSGTAPAQDAVVGSTGAKLYAFDPSLKQYRSIEASKKKFPAGKMPQPFYDLLIEQNPSLLLAIVDDASAEILDGLASVDMTDDVKIGNTSCRTLRLVDRQGDIIDLSIDPTTHLLRRSALDSRESYRKSGQSDVKKVLVTIDYAEVTPDAPVKDGQFAWKAPEGTRDVTAMADTAPEVGGAGEGAAADSLAGKPAADFKLKGVDGTEITLSSLKGSVVVLDFWATWCGPCRESLPHLNKLYNDKKEAGLKVFAIDLKEEADEVRQGITELKLTIPVLLDSDGAVAGKYLVTGIPQTVVIGKDGNVKKVFVGSGTHDQVQKVVEEAMK